MKMNNLIKLIILVSVTVFSIHPAMAQDGQQGDPAAPNFLTRERLQIRDPFKREMPKKQRLLKKDQFGSTNYSNVLTLEGIPLERIRVVGVILGKTRSALARIAGDSGPAPSVMGGEGGEEMPEVITIKEGMPLGVNGGEVRAILPGGIVVVEKIRNVYDQDEYLETIIPISE